MTQAQDLAGIIDTEILIGMRMCADGKIRAVYIDARGRFVRIDGRKIRTF